MFFIKEGRFFSKNLKLCEFILNSGFIDKNSAYHLTVEEETDSYNEPILYIDKATYTPAEPFEIKESGATYDSEYES